MGDDDDITELLQQAAGGDEGAFADVAEVVYGELERVAARRLKRRYGRELAGVSIEPSLLVNETLLKIMGSAVQFENRRHFYAFASRVMMRVMLDYQRRRATSKRGGNLLKVTLTTVIPDARDTATWELADVLEELERHDARKAEGVKLRIFWGLDEREIAELLDVSLTTVQRDWRFARTWLSTALLSGGQRTADP